jgi:hypothetical protein
MPSTSAASPLKPVLRPLSLAPLEPQQHSSRGHILSAFKKIDTIRVVLNCTATSDDGKYVVEVFSGRLHSRIPTRSNYVSIASPTNSAARQPTFAIGKSLDDFTDLRSQLYGIAHNSHPKKHCDFCRSMIEYALWSNEQPGAVARFFGEEEKTLRSLTKFLGDLVPMIESGCSTAAAGSRCRAQARIPTVVHEFLFGPSSESG